MSLTQPINEMCRMGEDGNLGLPQAQKDFQENGMCSHVKARIFVYILEKCFADLAIEKEFMSPAQRERSASFPTIHI